MSVEDAIRALARAEALSLEFPRDVLDEVARFEAQPGLDDPALEDLEGTPFVTVDGAGTRDLDQAVFVERTAEGFHLLYAIADASHYVSPGTALWREALARGASFYLPGLSIPMLPRALSEGLVSLGPDARRRALVFDVRLDGRGTVLDWRLRRARVRSRAKLSWEGADERLGGRPSGEPFAASVRALAELGALRTEHEDRKQMVRYRRVEAGLRLTPGGGVEVVREARGTTELASEQVSILCNALGARWLLGGSEELVQPIYRVHAPPDPERLQSFERLVRAVARERGLPDDPWVYRRAADAGLAGYLDALPSSGPQARLARALHRQAMVLNGRSFFTGEPAGHYGVAEAVYSRFTAPMRELVGVQCHAQAIERLVGRAARPREEDLALRAQVIDAGNRAKDVQRRLDREVSRLALERFLAADLARPAAERPARTGTVMGFSSSKIHVLLDDPPLDVRVSFFDQGKRLGGTWIEVVDDGARAVVRGKGTTLWRLGDEVRAQASGAEAVVLIPG